MNATPRPPHPGWARVAALVGPVYEELAPAVRATQVAPAQTEILSSEDYFALSGSFYKHLEHISAEFPRLADRINSLSNSVKDDQTPAPALEAACVELSAHLRACATWAERLSRVIPPLGFSSMFDPLRQIPAAFFGQFEAYLHVIRAAAKGSELPTENVMRIDVQSLIDAATRAGERSLSDREMAVAASASPTSSSGKGCLGWIVFFVFISLAFSFCGG